MIPLEQPMTIKISFLKNLKDTENYLHWRHQTVHVVSSVAIVAKEQFVVIFRGATQSAGLALDTLPGVLLHADQHVSRELQTCGMPWNIII